MAAWEVLGDEEVFSNPVLRLHLETIRTPGGDETEWTVVDVGDGAVVVATEDDHVWMIRQYRHAVGDTIWELPAGRVEPGETAEAAGRRELAEEAGLAAGSLVSCGSFHPLDGICRHRIHVLVASDLSPVEARPETFEDITVERLATTRLSRMIREGEIDDGVALAALARAGVLTMSP